MSAPEPIGDLITQEVHRLALACAQAEETACEAALQTGTCGVLEICRDGVPVMVGPHPSVPYGQFWVIHE